MHHVWFAVDLWGLFDQYVFARGRRWYGDLRPMSQNRCIRTARVKEYHDSANVLRQLALGSKATSDGAGTFGVRHAPRKNVLPWMLYTIYIVRRMCLRRACSMLFLITLIIPSKNDLRAI